MNAAVVRSCRTLDLLALSLIAPPTWAHALQGQATGFVTGLLHPVSGLDHVLAMVAVGLRGAQLGAPAIWRVAMAAAGSQTIAQVVTAAALFVAAALAAAQAVSLRRTWTRPAVRAAGSWIAASGMLLLGWTLSGRA